MPGTTREGYPFSDTKVVRLLRDPAAKGMRRANYTKSLGKHKKWVRKAETDWIITPCPAIVSEELWNECNQILASQEVKHTKPGPRVNHLLSGFIYCDCGKKMYVYHTAPVFTCRSCKAKIATSDIDEIYHHQLKAFLLTDLSTEDYLKQSTSILKEKEQLLDSAATRYGKIKKEMDELLAMRLSGEL